MKARGRLQRQRENDCRALIYTPRAAGRWLSLSACRFTRALLIVAICAQSAADRRRGARAGHAARLSMLSDLRRYFIARALAALQDDITARIYARYIAGRDAAITLRAAAFSD